VQHRELRQALSSMSTVMPAAHQGEVVYEED